MGSLLSSDRGGQTNVSTSLNDNIPIVVPELPAEVDGDGVNAVNNPNLPSVQSGVYLPMDTTSKSASNLDIQRQSKLAPNILNDTINLNNGTTPEGATFGDMNFNLFGTNVYPFKWLTMTTLYSSLSLLSSMAMIIGCVMPYVPQYLSIYKNKNSSGFSTLVCLTLLMANILRIAFWFGHPYELPLLIQSAVMIMAQILLLELCVRVKRQNSRTILKRRFFTTSLRYFWRWTDLLSYLEFLCLITALLGICTYFLIDCGPYVETIGYLALVTESMLGLPQVLKNYKNKSVEGMSLSMVIMWLGGDAFKTGYFITNNVPFQFWLCGLLQITIDLLILFQVCLFRQNAPVKKSSRSGYPSKEMEL